VSAKSSARRIADAQLLNQNGIAQAALGQVGEGVCVMVELGLIKGHGLVQQCGSSRERRLRQLLLQMQNSVWEGEIPPELHEADQVSPAPTTMTVE
jgi:hypothetical protein